ncbi:hypothetical protein ACFWZT_00725 [Streptomyces alboflavus]|uniref:hypothetical protein n=1 Tax=Streptomyces alboflavus TaxID=67267 RepID=UPI0036995584
MTPAAASATIAAHLTDELAMRPDLATLTAVALVDRLTLDGWEITAPQHARPVAPRAREPRARRLLAHLTRRSRTESTR